MKQAIGILLTAAAFVLLFLNIRFSESPPEEKPFYGEMLPVQQTPLSSKDSLNLYAQSAVLMDAETGRILYGKNENLVRPMASTTKIMTCIVALEQGNLSDPVTASKHAASQPKVHLRVKEGERFLLKDLLYSLMLESHNDSAMMIAEHIGGSQAEFAALMNQKAKDLGLSNTYFITPNGLDAKEEVAGEIKEHSTTAADLARIMNYCIAKSPQKEVFLEITAAQNHSFEDLDKKRSIHLLNHNSFLSQMKEAFSGKTGFTQGAGYTYVGSAKEGGRVYTIALLGCGWPPHKTYKWSDARKLFAYGLDRYHYRDVYQEPELPKIFVNNAVPPFGEMGEEARASLSVRNAGEKTLPLLLADNEEVTVSVSLPEELQAPLEKGQEVGAVVYRLNGEVVGSWPICLEEKVERLTLLWCLQKMMSKYALIPGLS